MTHPVVTRSAELVKQSIVSLYEYQEKLVSDVYREWDSGQSNVLAVMPTGAGKTVALSYIVYDHGAPSCVIAHRQELVSQISLALARNGVRHKIIGPNKVIRMIVSMQMIELGLTFYDPSSKVAVAGVDTLIRRNGTGADGEIYYYQDQQKGLFEYGPRAKGVWGKPRRIDEIPAGYKAEKSRPKDVDPSIARWSPTVTLWVQDEAHHVLKDNKWGTAAKMFPNAKGLGVTATPCRADGCGLGRHADGLFDVMVIGPTMRELINLGRLTEYKIFAPPSNIDRSKLNISGRTGEFNEHDVAREVSKSSLISGDGTRQNVGDIVQFYCKNLMGERTVTFVPSWEDAVALEKQFTEKNVPAKALNAKTLDDDRARTIREFKSGKILQLINIALFDEGFDLPAIFNVQDAYPTASFSRFSQRFGRMLRKYDGKLFGKYIDHAGNVMLHGLPDAPREWTLDRREKRSSGATDAIPLRICTGEDCYQPFERYLKVCPHCGTPIPPPAERAGVEWVDGDLYELDEATLAAMRGEVAQVDLTDAEYHQQLIHNHCPSVGIGANLKRHREQRDAVTVLREVMAWWAGHHRAAGLVDGEIFRKFYLSFGVDWLTAQALKRDDAMALAERVSFDMGKL